MIAFGATLVLAIACALAPQESERDARIASWREALELDLAQEVLEQAPGLVAPGAALEHDGEALALFARAQASRGGEERARALLEAAQPSEATRGHVVLELARLEIERDELSAAIARLSRDKQPIHPELADSYLLLGRATMRLGDPQEAAQWLKTFVESAPLSPEAPAAWHMLGQAALARRDLETARVCASREERLGRWQAYYRTRRLQIREKPSEPLPRMGLAQLWLEVDQPARAREVLLALTEMAPSYCAGWFGLGEAERKLGELESAFARYTRALDCDPEQPFARFNRAVISRMAGRDAEARADFERLVASRAAEDPRLLGAHLELARILLRAGEREPALQRYAIYEKLGGKEPLEPPATGGR